MSEWCRLLSKTYVEADGQFLYAFFKFRYVQILRTKGTKQIDWRIPFWKLNNGIYNIITIKSKTLIKYVKRRGARRQWSSTVSMAQSTASMSLPTYNPEAPLPPTSLLWAGCPHSLLFDRKASYYSYIGWYLPLPLSALLPWPSFEKPP